MAGKVPVRMDVYPDYMEIAPHACPAQGPKDSDPPAYEPVRCMSYTALYGPRYCPFYVYTARDPDLKQRVSTPLILASEMDQDTAHHRNAHVCCQLAKGGELRPGA